MADYVIAPSILSADFARLGEEATTVLAAGANWIHFDVMDNHYVPNLTVGPMVCQALRQYGVTAPIDVHLMVEPVDPLIQAFAEAGASRISFHPEASKHPHRSIQLIKDCGCQAGLALNPGANIDCLPYLLKALDLILVMSVNPGFGGQSFIPETLEKIRAVKTLLDTQKHPARIEVDGGINKDTIAAAAKAGADTFVAGSAIFTHHNYTQAITELRRKLP